MTSYPFIPLLIALMTSYPFIPLLIILSFITELVDNCRPDHGYTHDRLIHIHVHVLAPVVHYNCIIMILVILMITSFSWSVVKQSNSCSKFSVLIILLNRDSSYSLLQDVPDFLLEVSTVWLRLLLKYFQQLNNTRMNKKINCFTYCSWVYGWLLIIIIIIIVRFQSPQSSFNYCAQDIRGSEPWQVLAVRNDLC